MQSLATLSEEKARIEASFQADRKMMLANQETLYKQPQTEREKAEKEHNELRKQLENVQSTLQQQQQQRERREEEVHHKEMWMELQSLLALERVSKEDLELKLQDLESSLDTHKLMGHKAKEYEQNVSVLSQQLQHVTEQLSRAEEQASHPPPLLATLQQEMEQMKEEHLHAMAREQSKVSEVEDRLQQQALREEQLV
ncbi:GRIP and coiled-coil domain-containing protein 1-like isoform X2 [Dysidea avara]